MGLEAWGERAERRSYSWLNQPGESGVVVSPLRIALGAPAVGPEVGMGENSRRREWVWLETGRAGDRRMSGRGAGRVGGAKIRLI